MSGDTGMAQDDVLAAEQRWNEVYLAGDADAFADLLLDDFVYTSERGVFNKTTYVANLATGVIDMRGLTASERTVRLHASTAVVTGTAHLDASLDGQDISGDDRYTRVWIHDGTHWRALAQHANQVAS
jgi:ketosteroid isomerase-like protein